MDKLISMNDYINLARSMGVHANNNDGQLRQQLKDAGIIKFEWKVGNRTHIGMYEDDAVAYLKSMAVEGKKKLNYLTRVDDYMTLKEIALLLRSCDIPANLKTLRTVLTDAGVRSEEGSERGKAATYYLKEDVKKFIASNISQPAAIQPAPAPVEAPQLDRIEQKLDRLLKLWEA